MGTARQITTAKVTDKAVKEPLRVSGDAGSERITSVSWQACVLVTLFLIVLFESRTPLRNDVELVNGYVGVLYREALGCLTAIVSTSTQPEYVLRPRKTREWAVGHAVRAKSTEGRRRRCVNFFLPCSGRSG